tara:strand:- start:326 stop:817 length:492 start_codon:yes stop_codon:yes gene_type:complete
MLIKRIIFTLIILPLFFISKLAFADFESGLKLYNSGTFKEELQIWIPLAESDLSNTHYNVGLMHHNVQCTSQNFSEAFKWFLISSEQENFNSIRLISTMYALVNGVEKDFLKSYMWAKIRSDNDVQNIKLLLDGLIKEMNKAEILVKECNNKNFRIAKINTYL